MNIFFLHKDVNKCAQHHVDKHVVKMIVEYAQLLSTAHFVFGSHKSPMYKPTHANHPCGVWVRQSRQHYIWLYSLFVALCKEYTHRYGKVHKTSRLIKVLAKLPTKQKDNGWHKPALAMPAYLQTIISPTQAYRCYYLLEKQHLLTWTNRKRPHWA